MKVYCSSNKLRSAQKLIESGPDGSVLHGNIGKCLSQHDLYSKCVAFWDSFFMNCQRPNADMRLFPVNMGLQDIYTEYFLDWYKDSFADMHAQGHIPSVSTMKRARYDEMYADVKKRPKHFHARCPECANLMARRMKGFADPSMKDDWSAQAAAHEASKSAWRKVEHC